MITDKKILGKKIKEKRLEKKITQRYLAEQIGISRNYLSDIENGRYMPSVGVLFKLAYILELDLNSLKSTNISEVS
ncbi:MAG: helix-turn-helix transcriptional regulator [Thermoanaerobacterium sp.]|nr:helix-turn-helix transcriptional regulator [Thermoanaerobacterium sp.]